MIWNELQKVVQDDSRDDDGYTTYFRSSITIKRNDTYVDKIFRIKFRINNSSSGSWNDRCLEYLTKNGWETIGTDADINLEWDNSFQSDVRIAGIRKSCDNWTKSCKDYIKKVIITL